MPVLPRLAAAWSRNFGSRPGPAAQCPGADGAHRDRTDRWAGTGPRHVRVGLGMLIALALWALILLAGALLFAAEAGSWPIMPGCDGCRGRLRYARTSSRRASSAATAASNISAVSRRVEVLYRLT